MSLPPRLRELLGDDGELPHLEQALVHPSHANESRRRADDYQRLEFLGDAVLSLCVSEALFARNPSAREGELSLLRANAVSTDALASFARSIDLGAALLLGKGADAAGERDRASVLADALEAVVGAIYLDRGLEAARALALVILDHAQQLGAVSRDPKSELQERVQALGAASPRYAVVGSTGPDHERLFTVRVEALGRTLGEGSGRSKKAAEQEAARAALLALAEAE